MPATIHPSGLRNRLAAARLKAAGVVSGDGMHISVAGPNACRFIAGDARAGYICGQSAEPGLSWCQEHCRVVFAG
jgi:hypothetical protein